MQTKDIEGFEGRYAITDDGRVWSYLKNDFMSPFINSRGYAYVGLRSKDGKRKAISIHRLVAQAFLPNPENLSEVNHKDENKLNNCVNNLEWCTHKYNMSYGTCVSRLAITQQNTSPLRKAVQCIETGEIYHSAQEACRQTGINNTSISKVCNGKRLTAGGYHWIFINIE